LITAKRIKPHLILVLRYKKGEQRIMRHTQKIYALIDYKNRFGSKWSSKPYRSGYDKSLLKKYFNKYGYELEFIQFKDVDFKNEFWKNKIVIYTSSEEIGNDYKSYIEDVILGLENAGAKVIPEFKFLRAHNNKVFMEILRDQLLGKELSGISSKLYGTLDELKEDVEKEKISFPCVIKKAEGSMSRGVHLAKNRKELLRLAKKITRTRHFFYEIKDKLRRYKYKGYRVESKFQKKIIIQPFIPGLKNDWKILIYGEHYYILKRGIKKNDFRASGSHYNYQAGSKAEFPLHLLNQVEKIYRKLNVPYLSLDFAYDGNRYYIHEIQAIYFGTSVLDSFCDRYYTKKAGKWILEKKQFDSEEEYVSSLINYLNNKGLLQK
jgi:glutathione synthase/RimK-type ligase-like ATP-grasp enzyme